jgi:hypothetical protein
MRGYFKQEASELKNEIGVENLSLSFAKILQQTD